MAVSKQDMMQAFDTQVSEERKVVYDAAHQEVVDDARRFAEEQRRLARLRRPKPTGAKVDLLVIGPADSGKTNLIRSFAMKGET